MRGEREENRLMEYTITPLTPRTGAEVRGIDLNEGVDTETRAALLAVRAHRGTMGSNSLSSANESVRGSLGPIGLP
jgi:hypothetical protein